jgi:hypothetical protein
MLFSYLQLDKQFYISPPFIEETLDWRRVQTLVRSMPGLHKTLIIACVKPVGQCLTVKQCIDDELEYTQYTVKELAIASEHAPFRHKNIKGVGMQIKST